MQSPCRQPPRSQFNNRIRNNWQLLWAIADLAGGEWPKRARAAALELETERDEPSEGLRLLAAIRDIFGTREAMTSADICAALVVDPSGEWANFRDKGPISQTQLAVLLKLSDQNGEGVARRHQATAILRAI
jgi:hypothetical protein